VHVVASEPSQIEHGELVNDPIEGDDAFSIKPNGPHLADRSRGAHGRPSWYWTDREVYPLSVLVQWPHQASDGRGGRGTMDKERS
jgi:hypothetical protein